MKTILLAAVSAALLGSTLIAMPSSAGESINSGALVKAVTVANIRAHQAALQAVADANNGERASGTPGFEASAAYVKSQLESVGYTVTEQPFDFPFFQELSPPELERVSPAPRVFNEGKHFSTMEYSGADEVTAVLQPVKGIIIPPTPVPSSSSGCRPAHFEGFVPGNIALVQRGTCTFAQKAANAAAAGATAVIIFNEGQPGRIDNFGGTLGGPVDIPVFSASFDVGSTLFKQNGPTMRVKADTQTEIKSTKNLLAETTGRPDRVVVVGAHLDSVPGGAGIEDNGSGSSAILEIAKQVKTLGLKPANRLRFMWFGAEEAGLLGSEHYVASLSGNALSKIMVNLNFDMIASPNYIRYVYDGDGSDTPTPGPRGSGYIENIFGNYLAKLGLPYEPTAFDGRSDYGPFIAAGIPAGGLFTGAEAIKTDAEAAIYGGTAGEALDPCYHQACDDYDNNNEEVLGQMSAAAAHTTYFFAMTARDVGAPKQTRQSSAVAADALDYRGSHLQR